MRYPTIEVGPSQGHPASWSSGPASHLGPRQGLRYPTIEVGPSQGHPASQRCPVSHLAPVWLMTLDPEEGSPHVSPPQLYAGSMIPRPKWWACSQLWPWLEQELGAQSVGRPLTGPPTGSWMTWAGRRQRGRNSADSPRPPTSSHLGYPHPGWAPMSCGPGRS